jgi:transposase
MAEPVRARRLTDQEGRRLLQIVRRGKHGSVIVTAARTRPEKLGLPFTRWSLRKMAGYLARHPGRPVRIGRERLRQVLHERGISFQRTGPGRNPPIRTGTPSWTGSST